MRGVFNDSSPFLPPGAPPQTPQPSPSRGGGDTTCVCLVFALFFVFYLVVGGVGGGKQLAMCGVTSKCPRRWRPRWGNLLKGHRQNKWLGWRRSDEEARGADAESCWDSRAHRRPSLPLAQFAQRHREMFLSLSFSRWFSLPCSRALRVAGCECVMCAGKRQR